MEKLKVKLEHCYGIKKLKHEFDFSDCRTFVIYAPNGVMKTSFAKTFKAISGGKDNPCDQMDDTLTSIYNIFIDNTSEQIDPDKICVIEPYNEKVFNSEDKILTLLADEKTRKEYLKIYNEIESSKKSTISGLKKISGSSNYEPEIMETFSYLNKRNIFEIFDSILGNIKSSSESFKFKYNDVFDPAGKVKKFLENNIDLLKEYIEKYESLITQSSFFSKDDTSIFGTTEAKSLSNALDGDDYFIAGHKLSLKEHGEIEKQEIFSSILNEEINKIFNDENLKKTFTKIDKLLDANKDLMKFKKVIEKDNSILPRLADYEKFRKEVWFSFLKQIESGLRSLVDLYNSKSDDLEKIIQKAKKEESAWEDAIREFENRFIDVPFTLEINNKSDAILNEKTPAIDFKFHGKNIERENLVDNILSQGERRAFYLLNVIFEIKSRQLQKKETLYVIDDIADSFDYKNKYAIVEYLNDLSKENDFYCIIMTHNFDFFRTLQSRILQDHKWKYSFIAEKMKNEIKLIDAGSRNVTEPFADWKNDVKNNEKYLIACIPFVRNLIDFKEGKTNNYRLLTHTLHQKEKDETNNIKATTEICIEDLETIFTNVLGVVFEYQDKTKKIIDIINVLVKEIKNQQNSDSVVLEDKVILSIGIRLIAEKYIWSQVNNKTPISGSQTGKLFQRYKDEFSGVESHIDAIKTLERVNIMTPENIHLNSFMYEPILDMGIYELKKLYDVVSALSSN